MTPSLLYVCGQYNCVTQPQLLAVSNLSTGLAEKQTMYRSNPRLMKQNLFICFVLDRRKAGRIGGIEHAAQSLSRYQSSACMRLRVRGESIDRPRVSMHD